MRKMRKGDERHLREVERGELKNTLKRGKRRRGKKFNQRKKTKKTEEMRTKGRKKIGKKKEQKEITEEEKRKIIACLVQPMITRGNIRRFSQSRVT